MFVSLLQLLGFAKPEPVHSRAEENVVAKTSGSKTSTADVMSTAAQAPKVQEKPVRRRSTVKAQAVKPKPSTEKSVVADKPVKLASKPAGKPPAESVAKAKPATKKALVKAAPPPRVSKPDIPAKPTKSPSPVSVAKVVPPISKKKPEEVTKKIQAEPAVVPAKPVAVAAPQLTPLGVPVRSGRPSSRLAQLTVPSMAQSVASTAAKASFTQMTSVQPIVPPLASSVKKDPTLANNWRNKPVTELTDAEVLAMSDDDYMNDTQMAYFRMKLVTLKNDILSNAGETTEHLREDTVVVPDPADRATIEEEHALELRTRDRERKLLKKIEQSIGRIDAGDYGYCDETGEAIGVGRLLARPTATLSLEAQQRRELKQKMFGD